MDTELSIGDTVGVKIVTVNPSRTHRQIKTKPHLQEAVGRGAHKAQKAWSRDLIKAGGGVWFQEVSLRK